jgi:hypothetical protein
MTQITSWDDASEKMIKSLNGDMQKFLLELRSISDLPFQIIEGRRSTQRQQELWEHGEVSESRDSPYCRGTGVNVMITMHSIPCFSPEIYLELAQCAMFAAKNLSMGVYWGATGGLDLRLIEDSLEEKFLDNQKAHSDSLIVQNQRLQYFELA